MSTSSLRDKLKAIVFFVMVYHSQLYCHRAWLSSITNNSQYHKSRSAARHGFRRGAVMEMFPFLWIFLTWMTFPILALALESSDSIETLRPWSTEPISVGAADASTAACGEDRYQSCSTERLAWNGNHVLSGRILFVSIGFHGHAVPLLALAEEMALRGHAVSFGTHSHLRSLVDATPGVAFVSAGRMPMHDHELRGKLKALSQAGGFWGLLTLLKDVYLPLARPMYRALLASVCPLPTPPVSSSHSCSTALAPEKDTEGGGGDGGGAGEGRGGRQHADGDEFDVDVVRQGPRAAPGRCGESVMRCDGGDDRGTGGENTATDAVEGACPPCIDGVVDSIVPRTAGRAHSEEDQVSDRMPSELDNTGEAKMTELAPCQSPPFDLVVVDIGSLGGLHLAQKLGLPYMFNSPSLLFDLSGRYVTATLPGWGTGMSRRMSLGDRLQNAISPRALSVFLTPAFIFINRVRREEDLEPFHAQDDVFHGARVLVNTAFGLEYPHDLTPLVEMTGPLLPPRVARSLAEPVTRHMESPLSCAGPTSCQGSGQFSLGKQEFVENRGKEGSAFEVRVQKDDDPSPLSSTSVSGGQCNSSSGFGSINCNVSIDHGSPLALPFLIQTWLGGTGALVAPGTAAYNAATKQARQAAKHASTSSGNASPSAAAAAAAAAEFSSLVGGPPPPNDRGVIYVSLGRMPQLDKWQLVTVFQALSSSSEGVCRGGGGSDGGGGGLGGGGMGGLGNGGGSMMGDGGIDDRLGQYRVLWAMPREQKEELLSALLPMAPPPSFRLKVMDGLPHLGILAHASVKAVISHCGMGAAQEALVFGKPLLCLPMLAEQQDVARRVIDTGAGLSLPGLLVGNVSAGAVRNAVADLVTNPAFRSSARVLSGLLRRAGGTLRAADVVEGTLQLGGGAHLHPPELNEPWHQTSSADAYSFILAAMILVAVLGYAMLAALCYGARLLILKAVRFLLRVVGWVVGLQTNLAGMRQRGCTQGQANSNVSKGGVINGGKGNRSGGGGGRGSLSIDDGKVGGSNAASGVLSPRASEARAAAAAAAAPRGGSGGGGAGGLWDEAMMALLGGPSPRDPFPEDSLPELDGPAIDRQPAPGTGGRNGGGSNGGRSGGANGAASGDCSRGGGSVGIGGSNSNSGGTVGTGAGGGRGGGHLRSLSGELVTWSAAPHEGRTYDFRGWNSGSENGTGGGGGMGGRSGGSYSNGHDVSTHLKRWD